MPALLMQAPSRVFLSEDSFNLFVVFINHNTG